ncbi:MAG: spore protease YyaC [Lachnospiraceae bacterium]|jgi:putative sporulation protein YyaC
MTFYINKTEPCASSQLGALLTKCIRTHTGFWDELIFLCIGSDRITGDSLGPLIGDRLKSMGLPRTFVYGTLQNPVHALNLEETMTQIHQAHSHPLLIAIDASLGTKQHLGYITLGSGPLFPGAGVHKSLPPVGDIFITGIVSQAGTFEHFFLQTTRLSTIISLSDTILHGILMAYQKGIPNPLV